MDNNNTKPKDSQERKNSGEKAIDKFCEQMIDRLQSIKASD